MFELSEIEELKNKVNFSSLYEIAKKSAQIGNEILKVNYNKIQKISSKGRKGDLVSQNKLVYNGERGIRTLDKVAPIQHFQCCAFNHSAISPKKTILTL